MKPIVLILFILISFSNLGNGQSVPLSGNEGRYKGTAIIFGMSNYMKQLPNTLNDADSMSIILKELDFDVVTFKDCSLQKMKVEIDKWSNNLKNYDVCLFYFSGHGAEVNGQNYLFPIGATVGSPGDMDFETYALGRLMSKIDDARNISGSKLKTGIVFLDACRDNPFIKSWAKAVGNDGGLINMNIPNGTLVAYATSPGKVSSAKGLHNSPYTEALLLYMRFPNVSIFDVLTKVNARTRILTRNEPTPQVPYFNTSLDDILYLNVRQQKGDIKSVEINANSAASTSIISFLRGHASLGGNIDDVLEDEWGTNYRGSIKYNDLPVAGECSNNNIRYYWRYLNESAYKSQIMGYLSQHGIDKIVNNNSYILYFFKDGKLYRKEARLFFDNIYSNASLSRSFGVDQVKYPDRFYTVNGNYFSSVTLDTRYNATTVAVGLANSVNNCSADWWYTSN